MISTPCRLSSRSLSCGRSKNSSLELASSLDHRISEGRHRVTHLDAAQKQVVLDLDLLIRPEGHDVVRRPLLLQINPRLHHARERRGEPLMADAGPDAHPLKCALAEVVGQPADMVHVAVAERHEWRAQRRAGAHPDVEGHVELGHLDHRLFPRHADALDAVGRDVQETKLPDPGGHLRNHSETSRSGASASPGNDGDDPW